MEASPDVAVDRRPGSLQIGSLRLRRSGNLASSLTVGILPESNGVRYATMNSHYYPLLAVAPATVTIPSGTNWVHTPTTVTFAANQAEAEVQVRPIADEVIERHVVWWKLSAPVSTNYALGHRTTASVAIYDGPEWTLHEITDDGTSFGDTQAFALNSDLNGSGQPYPKIAGLAVIEHTNVHAFSGAWWQSTVDQIETFYDTSYPASRAARVLSLSDSIAGAARHVGFKLDSSDLPQPIKAFDAGGYTNLPISTGWYHNRSAAHGISPNGTWIAGYATCFDLGGGNNFTYERRPVFWTWSGSAMTDLRGGSPPYSNDGDGEANAVNSIGEFVGSHADIEYVVRGFRTRTNGVTIAESDHLLPPIQKYPGTEDEIPDGLILKSTAHAISPGTIDGGQYKSGIAAGWSDLYFNSSDLRSRPTTWTRRANSEANPRGKHSPIPDSYSTGTILGINGFDAAVGWLGDAIGSNRRAAYWRLWWVGPIQLSDPHTVYGIDASWILSEAVAISESGAIVGNGTKNNYPRGFLLIRQASN